MRPAYATADMIAAAEPIVRFVSKKLSFDEMHGISITSTQDMQRAAAHAALEAAAWSIDLMPETADILAGSPVVRAEVLRLLDLENEELDSSPFDAKTTQARLDFAASIRNNARLYAALKELAPDMAGLVDRLVNSRH
jgi:hypothetical protein